MALAYLSPLSEIPFGQDILTEDGQVRTAYQSVNLWSDEDLSAAGLARIVEPGPVPYGQRVASSSLALIEGEVQRVVTLEDAPLPSLKSDKLAELARLRIELSASLPLRLLMDREDALAEQINQAESAGDLEAINLRAGLTG